MKNLRAVACNTLLKVIRDHRSLNDILPDACTKISDKRDAALLQELCFGVMRYYWCLDKWVNTRLSKALKSKDLDVKILMLLGAYQIVYLRIPNYAAINDTVAACKNIKKIWAKNLVNAILRSIEREQDTLQQQLVDDEQALYSHPQWLIDKLRQEWPAQWQDILEQNNKPAPMTLRVNCMQAMRDEYLQKLQQAKFADAQAGIASASITLSKAVAVEQLPGFKSGEVSVQDTAAQFAAELLAAKPGMRILDACTAPGGKSCHILETVNNDVKLLALDISEQRLQKIQENLQRLQLTATCKVGDACLPDTWYDGKQFDRILLDAPCSATGVIRRHPDIKYLRLATDIAQLATLQLQILQALWPLLKPGGVLLYATCSVMPEENNQTMAKFLAANNDAKESIIDAEWGRGLSHGRQILPGEYEMDGFYYALLAKV